MKMILSLQDIEEIKNFISSKSFPHGLTKIQKDILRKKANKFLKIGESLFYLEGELHLKVIADDDINSQLIIMKELHLPDHTGMKAMYENSKKKYCGFKRERIENFVRNCEMCKQYQPLKRHDSITPIIVEKPWKRIQVDCIDLRKYSEHNDDFGWIINIIDCYSKFIFAFPSKNKSAESVKNALDSVIMNEGAPTELQTDNGKEFVNESIRSFCEMHNICHIRGRPRHPQNQGQIERANQTIVRKLAKSLADVDQKRWIDKLNCIVFKYNRTWHRAIGTTPMTAFRGRSGINSILSISENPDYLNENASTSNSIEQIDFDNILSVDTRNEIIETTEIQTSFSNNQIFNEVIEAHRNQYIKKMKEDADVHYMSLTFNPGDKVLISKTFDNNTKTRRNKFENYFEKGIWTVTERIGNDSFKVEFENESKIVFKNNLKKF